MYNNGVFSPISVPGAVATIAFGINNAGDVVGYYCTTLNVFGNCTHAFLDHNGSFTTLDYPGAIETSFQGINDSDVILGEYGVPQGQGESFFGFLATPAPEPSSVFLLVSGMSLVLGLVIKNAKS